MTTPTEDARAALAEYDASETQHDAVLVVPEIVAALRALIEPPTGDERHSGYSQLHELVKDAPDGVRHAVGNEQQRVLANGSFSLHPSMLLRMLTRAYEQGVRRQLSHSDDKREALAAARSVQSYLAMLEYNDPDHSETIDDGYGPDSKIASLEVADLRVLAAGFRRQVSHPEPEEWEYGLLNPQPPVGTPRGAHLISDNREHIERQHRRGHPLIQFVRRRKAGPWLPVPEEGS